MRQRDVLNNQAVEMRNSGRGAGGMSGYYNNDGVGSSGATGMAIGGNYGGSSGGGIPDEARSSSNNESGYDKN